MSLLVLILCDVSVKELYSRKNICLERGASI